MRFLEIKTKKLVILLNRHQIWCPYTYVCRYLVGEPFFMLVVFR